MQQQQQPRIKWTANPMDSPVTAIAPSISALPVTLAPPVMVRPAFPVTTPSTVRKPWIGV